MGGQLLDLMYGSSDPKDGDRPESWIASLVPAENAGMVKFAGEGLTHVCAENGFCGCLADIFKSDPLFYFGRKHRPSDGLGYLVKLLDR